MSEKTFDFPAPRPWRIDGQAIRDREGGVVMSALNPASMETRKLIVLSVNGKSETSALADADTRLTDAAKEIERLRAALNGFADEWEKYAEEENMRAPAWASCFRSFARDCRKAIGGE